MAISTFAELKTAAASWLHDSSTTLAAIIPDFVALAEADIRKDVSCRAMESLATGTLTGETLAYPTRFLEARRLTVNGDVYSFETPETYAYRVDSGSTARIFTVIGESIYILGGTSGDTYTLLYRAAFAPLSAAGDTNWLLTNHPETYLRATLKHGWAYLENDPAAQREQALYMAAVNRVNTEAARAAVFGPLSVRSSVAE